MSGTGMITLPAIQAMQQRLAMPLLSSNLCGAWWLMRAAGCPAPSRLFATLCPALSRLWS
jgi:maleate isomerase